MYNCHWSDEQKVKVMMVSLLLSLLISVHDDGQTVNISP